MSNLDHLVHGVRNRGLVHCENCPACHPEAFAKSRLTARYHFTISDEEFTFALAAGTIREAA